MLKEAEKQERQRYRRKCEVFRFRVSSGGALVVNA